ncbi:hypothetical protein SDRG_14267 [Saprolegnia diclina VS20]|uniref:Uncharacterized protein n=1 Tax=Saprolegnia diclina (strain VS20) TaxID=1156394 RepID=T0REI5_SAPDV|nr:hypothetical protein SDRG_14267 [Saprolegnia diclina VS20]EQC27992.1 hypothetical protein SDRG_14267 [Saprolegnia diclina VS20]|eukprot:XP_008618605.1 hypothetical protein SDRG_14267 [Saprolegnia diclina VS20]
MALPVMTTLMVVVWRDWWTLLILPALAFALEVPLLPPSWCRRLERQCLTPGGGTGPCDPDRTLSQVKLTLLYLDVALFVLSEVAAYLAPASLAPKAFCGLGLTLLASLGHMDGFHLGTAHNASLRHDQSVD